MSKFDDLVQRVATIRELTNATRAGQLEWRFATEKVDYDLYDALVLDHSLRLFRHVSQGRAWFVLIISRSGAAVLRLSVHDALHQGVFAALSEQHQVAGRSAAVSGDLDALEQSCRDMREAAARSKAP